MQEVAFIRYFLRNKHAKMTVNILLIAINSRFKYNYHECVDLVKLVVTIKNCCLDRKKSFVANVTLSLSYLLECIKRYTKAVERCKSNQLHGILGKSRFAFWSLLKNNELWSVFKQKTSFNF